MPDDQLMSWGWRVPFWLSAVVVAVGYFVRRSMPETPMFEQVAEENEIVRIPAAVLFRTHTADVFRVIFAALISVISTIFGIFTLSYGVDTVGFDQTPMLVLTVTANVIALGAIPMWGRIADRVGRKPVFIGGALGCAVLTFPFLAALSSGNLALSFVFGLLLAGVVYSAPNAIWPSFYGEMFDTRVRYSGTAIGTQIGFALGGFAPTISTALLGSDQKNWLAVAVFTAGAAVVAAISASTARETYDVPTTELGSHHDSRSGAPAVTA
jgi:MFS family permease